MRRPMQCLFPVKTSKRVTFPSVLKRDKMKKPLDDHFQGDRVTTEKSVCSNASDTDDESSQDRRKLQLLVERQATHLPVALKELEAQGRKTSHWAWWAFPTEKPGASEPHPRTFVSLETAPDLLKQAPAEWRLVLELIADLVDDAGDLGAVVPAIDHGRILYFVKFWKDLDDTPLWLLRVIKRLEAKLTCQTNSAAKRDAVVKRCNIDAYLLKTNNKKKQHDSDLFSNCSSSSSNCSSSSSSRGGGGDYPASSSSQNDETQNKKNTTTDDDDDDDDAKLAGGKKIATDHPARETTKKGTTTSIPAKPSSSSTSSSASSPESPTKHVTALPESAPAAAAAAAPPATNQEEQ